MLQNLSAEFPARERVDEVELHGPDALGAHVVDDAQLVQPFGFGLRQLTQQIVAERLDGDSSQSSCDCVRSTLFDKSSSRKPFSRADRTPDTGFQAFANPGCANRQGIHAEAEAFGQLAAVVDLRALASDVVPRDDAVIQRIEVLETRSRGWRGTFPVCQLPRRPLLTRRAAAARHRPTGE